MSADWLALVFSIIGSAIGVTWFLRDQFINLQDAIESSEKKLEKRDNTLFKTMIDQIKQGDKDLLIEIKTRDKRIGVLEEELDHLKEEIWHLKNVIKEISPEIYERSFRRAGDRKLTREIL